MINSELTTYIQREIKKQVNILLTGVAGPTTNLTATIKNMYSGMGDQSDRPIMHPYGLVSRAPQGTGAVVGRLGDHPANRYTLGHLDTKRPELDEGDTALYNQKGAKIFLEALKVLIGSKSADEPLVLGNVFVEFMGKMIDAIEKIQVTCSSPGNVSTVPIPSNQLEFEQLRELYLTAKKIISDSCFTQKVITPDV